EDLLQVPAQLDLEAVAAKASAHVEVRTGRRGGFFRFVATCRVETKAQRADHAGDTELFQAKLLAGAQRLPPRLQVEQSGTARGEVGAATLFLEAVEVEFAVAALGVAITAIAIGGHCPAPRRTTISRAVSPAARLPRSSVIAK